MLVLLQALRVPLVSSLASASTLASSRASPALSTALTVLRNGTATRSSTGGTGGSCWSCGAATEFAVDEGQRLLPVHGSVTLMRVCVVTVAAVWVRGITVALDLACGWTLEARWARGEL